MGRSSLASGLIGLADLIWPPRSLLSERLVDRPGAIEPHLWSSLNFLSEPCCFQCGFPFEADAGPGAVCGACAADPPAYDRARAALAYDDLSRALVLDLKRAGRHDGLKTFATWMRHAGQDLVSEADIVAPTPLHWTRLVSRRFNQSAWLAQALAKRAGKKVALTALRRVKRRRSQADLDFDQRRRNVAGAFRADRRQVEGRRVLLVDDVFTTGATAEACAKSLRKAGAAHVDIVTLARVVRPMRATI